MILAAIKGYRRRRAWLVWHDEALARSPQLPSLRDLEGEDEDEVDEDAAAEQRVENLRLWKQARKAALRREQPNTGDSE